VGKTTLARQLAARFPHPAHFFDLENSEDVSRLSDPVAALKSLKGLVVLDEIQKVPDLFPAIRVLADRPASRVKFLILGSASPELLRQSSETLAGRIIYHPLQGFGVDEIQTRHWNTLWVRGGFPKAYLAKTDTQSEEWRRSFIKTFLESDIPQLGITVQSSTLRRFWTMLAHFHGQVWNASEFGRSFGVADTTVRHYLDILTSSLVLRQLLPWYENLGKRQVKSPKIYFADTGILHTFLKVKTFSDLHTHPKIGASWEGFVVGQIIRLLDAQEEECFFWATHAGAELDLLIVKGKKRFGFEIKRTSSPQVTPSMRSALHDLKLNHLDVIHAGEHTFPLGKKIRAVAFSRLLKDIYGYG
jgi:predicted AAA+ superfamily ATPase